MDVPATLTLAVRTGDPPGTIAFEADDEGLFYMCPCGCGRKGFLPFRDKADGERPSWNWDGNREAPTLDPSILRHELNERGERVGEHWHGHLVAGVWESC